MSQEAPIASNAREQRFIAANMTQAMRKLTEELGAEAILLSSRRVENGVEVIGLPPGASPSVDDIQELHSERRKRERRSQGRRASDRQPDAGDFAQRQHDSDSAMDTAARTADDSIDLRQTAADLARQIEALSQRGEQRDETEQPVPAIKSSEAGKPAAAQPANNRDDGRLEPIEYIVSSRLRQLRLSDNVVRQLLASAYRADAESPRTVENLWQQCNAELKKLLPATVTALGEAGGVYALVGPAAVGKTAAVQKLLARFVLEGRSDELALVSFANGSQSAAQRRLERLASVSGVECYVVSEPEALQDYLDQSAARRTVLIDTSRGEGPGCSYRDAVGALRHAEVIREVVCLSATSDNRYQRDMLSRYRSPRTSSCLFTHCDETQALGAIVSVLVEQQLPLLALSSGALLPEQLLSPAAEQLIDSLVEGSERVLATMSREVMTPIVNLSGDERAANH